MIDPIRPVVAAEKIKAGDTIRIDLRAGTASVVRPTLRERMALGYAAASAFALDSWAETQLAAERTQQEDQARLMFDNALMWDREHQRCAQLAYLLREMVL